nr:GNAT family protein [Algicella marina]
MLETNALGQPIGTEVPGWEGAAAPEGTELAGAHVVLRPLTQHDAPDLFEAYGADKDGADATYLPYGPYENVAALSRQITDFSVGPDLFYCIRDARTDQALGQASYLRINPEAGSIEVGNIQYGRALQRTRGATEAMVLMMAHAFDDLGYRRYEWKCNALNAPSCRAAERLGFTYEGTHRQALVVKGRNRDTAWYSILDCEWPALKAAFASWLDDNNFDAEGRQKRPLSHFREEKGVISA